MNMGTHIMKTTIEIADGLFECARAFAAKERITFRALVERALRDVLRTERQQPEFKLRNASVAGCGLQAEFRDADWQRIRDAAYKGRGN